MMTGPELAFVLLRADGVRVVALCPRAEASWPGQEPRRQLLLREPGSVVKVGSQALGGPSALPSEWLEQRCRFA
jgi:hypothetical protein